MGAWLGLVPRQRSTGGRPKLLGISKRGDRYLRMLLIHGARSSLRFASRRMDRRSRWALATQKRRGRNVAAVSAAGRRCTRSGPVKANYEPAGRSAAADADGEPLSCQTQAKSENT